MADRKFSWGRNLTSLPRIEHSDIKSVCDNKCNLIKKAFNKGYKFFWDSYVHNIEVKDTQQFVQLRANCYRSQKKSEAPHKIEITFEKDQALVTGIHWTKCSCTAGRGFCQHQIAVLFQLSHYQALNISRVPEIVSSTSAPQKWHIPPRTHGFSVRPVKEVTFMKPLVPSTDSSNQLNKRVRRECGVKSKLYNPVNTPLQDLDIPSKLLPTLRTCEQSTHWYEIWNGEKQHSLVKSNFGLVPRGSLLSYQEKYTEPDNLRNDIPPFQHPTLIFNKNFFPLPNHESTMYYSMMIDQEDSVQFEQDTRDQSKCSEWHNLRKHRITASTFKSVTGRRGKFSELARDFLKKRHIVTEAMAYGISHEAEAATQYSELFLVQTYPVGFIINPSAFHLGCSPDRVAFDQHETPSLGLLEVKCTVKPLTELTYLKSVDSGFALRKSHAYYEQCMGQMGLTGCTWCDFFVWSESEYHRERIYFDKEVFNCMKMKLDEFFFDFFLPLIANNAL